MRLISALRRRPWLTDAVLVFLVAAALIWPLFRLGYQTNWGSIESTFISDARFLRTHFPHPDWHPLWYCGTRFDYIYPPALRYGTALIAAVFGVNEARAYHLYTAIFYCFGVAGVYLLVWAGWRSRRDALLAALAAATVSPGLIFLKHVREDIPFYLPQRLNALFRYGEGPHITAVAWIPVTLAASWFGLRRGRPLHLAIAALSAAMVVSNNFYGATSLTIFYPVLVWAIWITERDHRVILRAAAVAVLAYGLSAAWLTPSYLRITVENLKYVSEKGNWWSAALTAAAAAIFLFLTWWKARGRRELDFIVFVTGSALAFSLNVLGNYYFKFRVAGEPERLIPELDLALILLALAFLRVLWRRGRLYRIAAWCVILACAYFPARYARNAWRVYVPEPDYRQRIEHRVTRWLHENQPGARVLATGSLRFWYNAWFDLLQVGGGSDQGVLHPYVQPAQWEINLGPDPEPGLLWLRALGADIVVVHQPESQEMYADFVYPKKFFGVLPVLWDSGEGDTIFAIPRKHPGLARVVDRARAESLPPLPPGAEISGVPAYVDLLEKGPGAPASLHWNGTDAFVVRTEVRPGEAVVAQVTYDPSWRASADGRPLEIVRDTLSFMRVAPPPGTREIRFEFSVPLENRLGRAAGLAALLILVALAVRGWRSATA